MTTVAQQTLQIVAAELTATLDAARAALETGAERDELYMPQSAIGFRCQHEAGGGRQAGQHDRRFGQRVLQRAAGGFDRGTDRLTIILAELTELQQAIHEKSQAKFGGQAAGRGMGREQQACISQVRHDVADCGGTQTDRQAP